MIKIKLPEKYKSFLTVDEISAIKEIQRDNYSAINENGIEMSDFTSYKPENVLKLELEWCRNKGVNWFCDDRLDDIDIYIHVIFYDGFTFLDEFYYLSDFMMRESSEFPKRVYTSFSKF